VLSLVSLVAATSLLAPAPPAAYDPVRLFPLPASARAKCRLARDFALCPRRLPRALLPRGEAPPLKVQLFRYLDGGGRVVQLTFGYGAPIEFEPPGAEIWRNRPCCFLHFDLYRRLNGPRHVPDGSRPAVVGGKRGLLAPAYGNNMACGLGDRGIYFCNHVRFAWRQDGTWYIATLHTFGRGTLPLLDRLIQELRPIT
jgi:hypothetical protein